MAMLRVLLCTAVWAATAARADDAPPPLLQPPAADAPREAGPPPQPPLPPPVESPHETPHTPSTVPAPDAPRGFFSSTVWGGLIGCGGAGILPAAGTLIGFAATASAAASLSNAQNCSQALGAAGCVGIGVVTAGTSLFALGPCSSCGACAGASIASMLDDRPLIPIVVGSAPGLAIGVLSPILLYVGATASSASGASADAYMPLLVTAAILGVVAGPVTVAGAGVADAMFGGPEKPMVTKPDPRMAPPPTTARATTTMPTTVAAMAF